MTGKCPIDESDVCAGSAEHKSLGLTVSSATSIPYMPAWRSSTASSRDASIVPFTW